MSTPKFLPYGRQSIDEDDINAVIEVLRGDWLTTGPSVTSFEDAVCKVTGAKFGVAVNSGTAALHVALLALGVGPGDEVIVPPMTFAATANSVCYVGATPVFADVEPETLLIDPDEVEKKLSSRTKAIIGVDYAGQPCNWRKLKKCAEMVGAKLVADSCHAIGARFFGKNVGTLADLTIFSFHPVKHITTGEGGMIVGDDSEVLAKCRMFRSHGIPVDSHQRAKQADWFYEMVALGYNYRMCDIQAALGESQLNKLPIFLEQRNAFAQKYDELLCSSQVITPIKTKSDRYNAYHLYVVRVPQRDIVFSRMRDACIGVNVHYVPVHFHPYYREQFGTHEGMCPVAEGAYRQILSLPMAPYLTDTDVERVAATLIQICDDLD